MVRARFCVARVTKAWAPGPVSSASGTAAADLAAALEGVAMGSNNLSIVCHSPPSRLREGGAASKVSTAETSPQLAARNSETM